MRSSLGRAVCAGLFLFLVCSQLLCDREKWPRGEISTFPSLRGSSQGPAHQSEANRRLRAFDDAVLESKGAFVTWIVLACLASVCCCCCCAASSDNTEKALPSACCGSSCCCLSALFLLMWLNKMIPFWDKSDMPAVSSGVWVSPCRHTGTECLATGTHSLFRVEACDSETFGKQVWCSVEYNGGVATSTSGGLCLCPEEWCMVNGTCQPPADLLPWASNATLAQRLEVAMLRRGEERKELTFKAVEECMGLRYRAGINVAVNPNMRECRHVQTLLETCGADTTAFYLQELHGQGGIGTFMSVSMKGILVGATARLVAAIVVLYLATALLHHDRIETLYTVRQEEVDCPSPCSENSGPLSYLIKLLAFSAAGFTLLQLAWTACVNMALTWRETHRFMQRLADLEGPCNFVFAAELLNFGDQAELMALCFVSLFDTAAWIAAFAWASLLCCSHCCYGLGCCWSYLCCCVCCEINCCVSLLGQVVTCFCGIVMGLIFLFPLFFLIAGWMICVIVWLAVAFLCVLLLGLAVCLFLAVFLTLAYALARVMACLACRNWDFTLSTFLKAYFSHVGIMAALILGLPELVKRERITWPKCGGVSVLQDLLNFTRLSTLIALVLPCIIALFILVASLVSKQSLYFYVAAQVDMTDFDYPRGVAIYNLQASWSSLFSVDLRWLAEKMYGETLPILYKEIPKSIIEALGDVNMPSISLLDLWREFLGACATLYEYLVSATLDIEGLIEVNYLLRVGLVVSECLVYLLFALVKALQELHLPHLPCMPCVPHVPRVPPQRSSAGEVPQVIQTALGRQVVQGVVTAALDETNALMEEVLEKYKDEMEEAVKRRSEKLKARAKVKLLQAVRSRLLAGHFVSLERWDKVCALLLESAETDIVKLVRSILSTNTQDLLGGLLQMQITRAAALILVNGRAEYWGLSPPFGVRDLEQMQSKTALLAARLLSGKCSKKALQQLATTFAWGPEDMLKAVLNNCLEKVGVPPIPHACHDDAGCWEATERCVDFFVTPTLVNLEAMCDACGLQDFDRHVMQPLVRAGLKRIGVGDTVATAKLGRVLERKDLVDRGLVDPNATFSALKELLDAAGLAPRSVVRHLVRGRLLQLNVPESDAADVSSKVAEHPEISCELLNQLLGETADFQVLLDLMKAHACTTLVHSMVRGTLINLHVQGEKAEAATLLDVVQVAAQQQGATATVQPATLEKALRFRKLVAENWLSEALTLDGTIEIAELLELDPFEDLLRPLVKAGLQEARVEESLSEEAAANVTEGSLNKVRLGLPRVWLRGRSHSPASSVAVKDEAEALLLSLL